MLPWIRWGERQAVLFDLPARKFHVFGLTLWPQDFYFLTWLLIIAALSLFFFTALAGRLFCGYACPQTVWTETFVWIERWVEGSRTQQMKLASAPWTCRKSCARATKYFLWVAFALWTGFTFVGYFTPITELAGKIAAPSRPAPGKRSGCCSTAAPPTSTRASCASRSASTCARTRASRARCSTTTR